MLFKIGPGEGGCLTGINGSDDAFNDNNGKTINPGQCAHDLTKSRQLCHHVQEQCHQGHEAEVQHGNCPVALSCPLCQDETFRTLAADDGSKGSKNEHRQRRCQGVNDDPLDTSDGCELGVGEEDTGSEGCTCQHDTNEILTRHKVRRGLERQHISHASIILIE